jgi:hypothetical protein
MDNLEGYVASPFCSSLELSCPNGNVLHYQRVNTHSTYPQGVKVWSRGTDGWYSRLATLDGPLLETGHVSSFTLIAKGGWSTWGNDYIAPSKQFDADLAAAIAAIPSETILQREKDRLRAPGLLKKAADEWWKEFTNS